MIARQSDGERRGVVLAAPAATGDERLQAPDHLQRHPLDYDHDRRV